MADIGPIRELLAKVRLFYLMVLQHFFLTMLPLFKNLGLYARTQWPSIVVLDHSQLQVS